MIESRRPVIALLAHDVHEQGGMERACAELVKRGSEMIDFVILTGRLAPELRGLVSWVPIRMPRRPFVLKYLSFYVRAGRALSRLDVDLVHTVGAIVPNRVDLISVHFCHLSFWKATGVLVPPGLPPIRRLNTTLSRVLALVAERRSYKPPRLRAFSAVSDGLSLEVRAQFPSTPVITIPNGVDLESFHPDVRARLHLREELGVPSNEVVALFVGGDWHHKGLALVIEALAESRSSGTNVTLWVVGNGNKSAFGALARKYGVESHVRFFGSSSDVQSFYQAADFFVLPSLYETFSLVCLEAAACGLPLVIPAIHGASDLVGNNDGGLIVSRSSKSLSAAFNRLALDEQLRLSLGQYAAGRAKEYTWESSIAAVLDLYGVLLKSSSRTTLSTGQDRDE